VKCILVEKKDLLGGTCTSAYVCHWGPGPGDDFAREIYDRLSKLPDAVGITRDHNDDRKNGSFGLWLTTPGLTYEETLSHCDLPRAEQRGVSFEPEAFHRVVVDLLEETGNCRIMRNTTFTESRTLGQASPGRHRGTQRRPIDPHKGQGIHRRNRWSAALPGRRLRDHARPRPQEPLQ